MKKLSLLIICVLALFTLISCAKDEEPPQTTDSGTVEATENKTELCVVKDSKSDYIIVVDTTDIEAKTLAYAIQQKISDKTRVIMPVRDINRSNNSEKIILVKSAGNEADNNSFSVLTADSKIEITAKNISGCLLAEKYVSEELLREADSKEWKLEKGIFVAYSGKENEKTMKLDKNIKYSLVYDAEDNDRRILANKVADYLVRNYDLNIRAVSDADSYSNEVLFGSVNRKESKNIERYAVKAGDYFAGIEGDKFVITSNDGLGIVLALDKFANGFGKEWNMGDNISNNVGLLPKDKELENGVNIAKKIYGTYSSWVEKFFKSAPANDKADQKLVEALIERMGDSMAVSAGSSSALYKGFIIKLDTNNYANTVKILDNGHIYIPLEGAEKFFNKKFESKDGYVDVTDVCSKDSNFSLFYDEKCNIAVITPKGVAAFDNPGANIGGYKNSEYIKRMAEFFDNKILPEPNNNIEQTRQEIMSSQFDSKYIYDYTKVTYDNYYSPGILVADKNGAKVMYVSHEISKLCNHKEVSTVTYLKKSTDGGKTFTDVNKVPDMRWASLVELDGKIYLLGSRSSTGTVIIARYNPSDSSFEIKDLGIDPKGTAPCTVSIHNGRLYRAHNNGIISIDVTKDLFDVKNWTVSMDPNLIFTREMYEKETGLKTDPKKAFNLEEGNTVIGKDGTVYAVYRIDATPTCGYAAIFKVSDDGTTVSLIESCNSIIKFPSTQSKFTIRYDEKTDLYITFCSMPTMNYPFQRNVLCMAVSKDLFNWQVVDTILVEREMMNNWLSVHAHAFQYVDFDFYGDEIVFVVRESAGDTCSYHDGTYLTMYRIKGYAKFIKDSLK